MQSLQRLVVASLGVAIALGTASCVLAKEPQPMNGQMSSPMPPSSSSTETPRSTPSTKLNASLTPTSAVPTGPTNGKGTATVNLYSAQNKLCYRLSVSGLDKVVGAQIYMGKAGKTGPVVVPLNTPGAKGISLGCAIVKPELLNAIARNPTNYYINVQTQQHEKGAVRGQLSVTNATMMKP